MPLVLNIVFDFAGADTAPGTSTVIDSLGPPTLRFKDADNATIDTNNGIVKQVGLTVYSRWKHLYGKCITAPPFRADNFRLYSDGTNSLGAGLACKIGEQFPTKNSGSSAGYEVANVSNEELVANHGGITSSVDIFSKTAASPLALTISETDNAIDAVNETTNYILLQAEVQDTAASGDSPDETLTITWDEA